MKDIVGTLRRIDEEIIGHNQLIARSRVEIARLQETRLVLAGIAESDTLEAQLVKEEGQRTIAGSSARPVLIVRKAGSDEVMKEQGLNAAGNRRGMNNPRKGTRERKPRGPGKAGEYITKVLEVLQGSDGMTSSEVANYLGVKAEAKARQPIYNALSTLLMRHKVHRDEARRFTLAEGPPQ